AGAMDVLAHPLEGLPGRLAVVRPRSLVGLSSDGRRESAYQRCQDDPEQHHGDEQLDQRVASLGRETPPDVQGKARLPQHTLNFVAGIARLRTSIGGLGVPAELPESMSVRRECPLRPGPSSESGQSLILALVVMLALSLSIAGVYGYLTSNETHFSRDKQSLRALSDAEAGLNDGLATVTKSDPLNAGGVGTTYTSGGPVQLDRGTFTWSATKQQAPSCPNALPTCWLVTANGTSPTGKVIHQLQQTIGWITKTIPTQKDESPVYGFGLFISNPPGDANCFKLSGSVSVHANVWFKGSFCPN